MSEETANDYTKYLENRIKELENKISKEKKKKEVPQNETHQYTSREILLNE